MIIKTFSPSASLEEVEQEFYKIKEETPEAEFDLENFAVFIEEV